MKSWEILCPCCNKVVSKKDFNSIEKKCKECINKEIENWRRLVKWGGEWC